MGSLKTLEPRMVAKWTTYLQMKATFYDAYVSSLGACGNGVKGVTGLVLCCQAYCFFGKELLNEEKCGESVRVLQHSQMSE